MTRTFLDRHLEKFAETTVGTDALNALFDLWDKLGRQIERRQRIVYQEQNLVTQQQIVATVAAIVDINRRLFEEYIPDPERREAALAQQTQELARLGMLA